MAILACSKPAVPVQEENKPQTEENEGGNTDPGNTDPDPDPDPDPNPDPDPDEPKDGPQLYNMSFDEWSKDGNGYDVCYGANATADERAVWGSANSTTAGYGFPTVGPETSFLAVSGSGKAACKVQSNVVSILFIKKFAAGSIFNGYLGEVNILKGSATVHWGIPFTERPKSLEGYACYKPATIDNTQSPYGSMEGKTDNGHITVILSDRQYAITPPNSLLDVDNDPGIIGYGKVEFTSNMDSYEKFNITIDYRDDRTPQFVTIVGASSALGDYFTGGKGSTLYMDEFKFLY